MRVQIQLGSVSQGMLANGEHGPAHTLQLVCDVDADDEDEVVEAVRKLDRTLGLAHGAWYASSMDRLAESEGRQP